MGKQSDLYLDFEIDKLTNSILNRISGDSFPTEISLLNHNELKHIHKKSGWNFDWKKEYADIEREVYKLSIEHNSDIVQGLISLSIKPDHIFMNLLESASFNRGEEKLYEGVAGNLVAFACKVSFQRGAEGFVAFDSKTNLIRHYEKTLGAVHFGGHRMIIDSIAATRLINQYFKV
ncbi:MAG: hypothetical protein IBJ09_02490 [Bacteroidia bacterium]|nr:hypothetical protein [Bacteroidia bacterium]